MKLDTERERRATHEAIERARLENTRREEMTVWVWIMGLMLAVVGAAAIWVAVVLIMSLEGGR